MLRGINVLDGAPAPERHVMRREGLTGISQMD
jgi:hypothetical protein